MLALDIRRQILGGLGRVAYDGSARVSRRVCRRRGVKPVRSLSVSLLLLNLLRSEERRVGKECYS